jgi:hypothetical protein
VESYRPWLRDEFSFRCVYCLFREQWGRVKGTFDLDHFLPVALHAKRARNYANLLYACAGCNLLKGARSVPDPLAVLLDGTVTVSEDGVIHAGTPEAAKLIEMLGLDSLQSTELRRLWLEIIGLAERAAPVLYRKLMGFSAELPNLKGLRPPGGNVRPEGIDESHFAKRERGVLPETY